MSDAPLGDLRALATVQDALDRIEKGGFSAGVVRMLILLARAHGTIRKDRLERSNRMLETVEPFASIPAKHKTRLVHRESLIASFEPEAALRTLPKLFAGIDERRRAVELCRDVAGPVEEMGEAVREMFRRFREVLEVEADFGGNVEDMPCNLRPDEGGCYPSSRSSRSNRRSAWPR
ncbi:MAG TPA: hypothetical protein PLZ79_03675 [Burkholderiales bacterium]|nr:hypothetical protein [Betaproteobacteria bacterium]HQR52343.1 hypothetical protein [Burkholderiales bacterium]